MKKNFSACVYTATAKAAKVINIEVNVFLNAEGAPVPGVYFAALNPGEITVFIEFNGVLFLFRTYQEETFYFRENELGAFLGAIASDVPGSIRARRLWPSFCVLLAIQTAGPPDQYQEAAEVRGAIIREREAEDAERERAEREAEERERQKEAAELEREITEGRARLLAGEEITGYQLEKLLQRYGVKVHPRTLHNIQRVRVIKPGELRYNRGTEARKMNADGVFKAFNQLADIIKAEAANVAPVAVPEASDAPAVDVPAVAVDQVPAPVAAVLPSFDVPGSLEASNNNAYADSEKSQNSAKGIQDFGQKIGGAHKDRIREAVAQLQGVDASALLLKPLSKVAKLPNLRALYESGSIDEATARRAWYLWNCIGTKPGASWPSRLQRWAERAAALIAQLADTLAYGVSEKSQNFELPEGVKPAQSWDLFLQEMTAANWPADEYKRGAYFVGHYWMNPARFSIHTEKGSYYTAFDTVAECVKAIRAKVEKNTTKEPQKFSMYQTSAGKYFISPKGKSGIKLLEFDNSADAWAAYGDTEKLGKIYEELKKFPSERRDWNRPRLGEDWRGGQDMTPEAFGEVFPFRGVEFGNWVNQLERAACLNECADALNDLAGVIGIRPEAVALGGSLAWAFGSRGVGKALAHYEPARRVVNLTKKKGNGCVAHEWFHALDNYMMIKAGKPSLMAVSDTHAYGDAEKSPVFEAAKALKNALLKSDMYTRSRRIDAFRSAPYWATVTEMAARGFEAVVFYALQDAGLCNDYLVSIKEATDYTRSECYPYPTREEAAELAPLYRAFIEAAFTEAEREVIKPAAELPAPPALVTYDPAQPIESAPFQVQDEAPAVAASEPMDANNDPTPADGGTGAAYGDAEKSPISEVRPEVEALRQRARNAGRWTSFDPEGLGDALIRDLENALQLFESKLPEEIRAEKIAAYISKWGEWLAARSRCISAAVTGPARFPVARAEKLWNYERNAWKRLEDWAAKVVRRCNAEQRLTGWDEVERLTDKAEKLERLQELMKEANKIVRQKISDVEKVDSLVALGFSEQEANEIMTPNYMGGIGFASFQLTNNLAKIKDTRAKIARHEALASKEDHSEEYEWGTLEYCYSDERYRLHFPGKPSAEILAFLKSHGWKWSRVNCAWQRQITPGAASNLRRFVELFGGKVEPSPEVHASEPMDANNDQTPADGVQGAAYGDAEKSQISINPGDVYKVVAADRIVIVLEEDEDYIKDTDVIRGRFTGVISRSDKKLFVQCVESGKMVKVDASVLPPVINGVYEWQKCVEPELIEEFNVRTRKIYEASDKMTTDEKRELTERMGFTSPVGPLDILKAAGLHRWNGSVSNFKNCAAIEWLIGQTHEEAAFWMNAGAYPVLFSDYIRRI